MKKVTLHIALVSRFPSTCAYCGEKTLFGAVACGQFKTGWGACTRRGDAAAYHCEFSLCKGVAYWRRRYIGGEPLDEMLSKHQFPFHCKIIPRYCFDGGSCQ